MIGGIPSYTEKFLLDINKLQKRSVKAQEAITSGLKISRVSDAPDDISRLLGARSQLDSAIQTGLNLGRVKVEADTAEHALQSAVSLVERARNLASQGASGIQNAATRRQIADELQGVLERLVAVSATAVEGRFLFSGDADQAPPYQLDPNSPKGVSGYQGSPSTRKVADASGLQFSVGQSADNIFDAANDSDNVFLAINGMRRALLAVDNPPDPPDATIPTLQDALRNLGTAGTYLNQRLAGYGLVQNRVNESIDTTTHLELSLRQQLANIEEADLAEAAVELTQTSTNLNAAFQARAQTPRRSLFDVLG